MLLKEGVGHFSRSAVLGCKWSVRTLLVLVLLVLLLVLLVLLLLCFLWLLLLLLLLLLFILLCCGGRKIHMADDYGANRPARQLPQPRC